MTEPAFAMVEAEANERLIVDVDGFEGPLDLLLHLARSQKVDLHKISVLALAEQYLAFVEAARTLRLELAADYLVMAAWLAYLKSRLLLPRDKVEEPEAGDLATALAERLRRLEAIRAAAAALDSRPRVGRDMMVRGRPEREVLDGGPPLWTATMYDLLTAYTRQRQKRARSQLTLRKRVVWSLADARRALASIAGDTVDWTALDDLLVRYWETPALRRTVRASALSVALEMVKEGQIVLRQDVAFAQLWLRATPGLGAAMPDALR